MRKPFVVGFYAKWQETADDNAATNLLSLNQKYLKHVNIDFL